MNYKSIDYGQQDGKRVSCSTELPATVTGRLRHRIQHKKSKI